MVNKTIILVFCIIILSELCYSMPVHEYKLSLDTKNEFKLDKINIEVKDFFDNEYISAGDYLWEISDNENVLNYSFFGVEAIIYYDIVNPTTGLIDDGGEKKIRFDEGELFIPYYPNANKINIFKFNQSTEIKELVLEIDVSRFAKNLTNIKEKINETREKIVPLIELDKAGDKREDVSFYMPLLIILILVVFLVFITKYKIFKKKR